MQLEFDWCDPDPEPSPSGVPYVPQMAVRSRPGAVPCGIEGGCEYGNVASRNSTARGGTLKRGGLCERHGLEKTCGYRPCGSGRGCGDLAMHGISEFRVSGDPSALLCNTCRMHKWAAARLAELDGKRCECGRKVYPWCPDGLLCNKCYRASCKGGALCSFEGCEETQESIGLCNGHRTQHTRGYGLTPLGSTYTMRDYDGCALYMFRGVLSNGATVDVFGVTEPAVEIRLRTYEGMSRGRPGLEISHLHGWFRWDDKATARAVEKELKSMAVPNSSLRAGLQTESWPADDAKVRVALATVMRYSPDHTNKGDSDE